jgi:hypothetical protein
VSPRAKTLLSGAATVLILAAVIGGIYAFSAPRHPAPSSSTQLTPSQLSKKAYQQGLKALSSKDTTGAIALFERAVTYDPHNSSAKKAMKDAKTQQASQQTGSASSTQSVKNSSTNSGAPQGPDPWATALSPRSLLPKAFTDYALGSAQADGPDATVGGSPTKAAAKVTSVVWSVHDCATPAKSASFLQSVTKSLYPKDAAAVPVNGVSAYFGTDGTRFASVAFSRNRYVFEVVLTSTDAPSSAKGLAEQAAAVFPTKP